METRTTNIVVGRDSIPDPSPWTPASAGVTKLCEYGNPHYSHGMVGRDFSYYSRKSRNIEPLNQTNYQKALL